MEWNAFVVRNNELVQMNIFNHCGFLKDAKKACEQYGENKTLLMDEIAHELQYWFWCRCEHEVIVSPWPPGRGDLEWKIDVYQQVQMNWKAFCEYVWAHREDLRKVKVTWE